jgi:putative hydrolase of the HAD superfamily
VVGSARPRRGRRLSVRFSAVFFDAGGTLVDAKPSFPELFATVLQREGHDVEAETITQHWQIVFDRFKAAGEAEELWTTSDDRSRRFWHGVYRLFLDEIGLAPEGLVDVVYREFTDRRNYGLYDDVLPVLHALRAAGLRLGIVSNFERWLDALLEDCGVRSLFEVRVISGFEGVEKPDPRIFRIALDRAGVDAGASVYVGDLPDLDVAPAGSVGMFPVLIDRRDRYPDALGTRIRSMNELPAVLGVAT